MYLLCAPYSRRMACFKEITLLIPMDPYLLMAMRLHLARKKIPKASKMKFFFLEQSTITFLDQSFHLKCLVSNVVFKVPPIATEKKIAKLPNCQIAQPRPTLMPPPPTIIQMSQTLSDFTQSFY